MPKKALRNLEFHVHCDFFLNGTAKYADIVLPVANSWEREGLRFGFNASLEEMCRVQLRPPVIAPIGLSGSITHIVLELSRPLGLSELMFDCDPDKRRMRILEPSGISLKELKAKPEGLTLTSEFALSRYS